MLNTGSAKSGLGTAVCPSAGNRSMTESSAVGRGGWPGMVEVFAGVVCPCSL
jgi:hypothetical protein